MQKQINTILVPTDFTEKSNNAVKMAVQIAKRHEAKILIFHSISNHYIIDRTGKQVIGAETVDENFRKIQISLDELHASLSTENPTLHFETILDNDNLIHGINKIIDQKNVDLVVSGSSGQQKISQLILGSMSYEILNGVNASVLLVPETCTKYAFDKILVPVRVLDDLADKVDLSLAIAQKNNGIITLLGISSETDLDALKDAYQEVRQTLVKNQQEYNAQFLLTQDKATQISKFSKDDDADIIILNYQDEGSWKSIFSENFFKQIINYTDIPLLFLKNKERAKNNETDDNAGFDITLPCPG
ncbi:universal stress protein [Chryseobacterium wangxinyae]|uniref:universal stress protein n=1 Tax=Chryseobacterium sp. CY353 TaxID=2997334 RepID=UPI002270472C|nr:universal stress protein [Chryseobacterium sp. CY353]MCY0968615.1 universal stress protein [Chryseobacterium sp. CY353]